MISEYSDNFQGIINVTGDLIGKGMCYVSSIFKDSKSHHQY